jgi:vacuolar-type H+-ATPase subunit F/Vma7
MKSWNIVDAGIDTSNALNLSESEDEEELEDVIDDFALQNAEEVGLIIVCLDIMANLPKGIYFTPRQVISFPIPFFLPRFCLETGHKT